jgi:predicted nucleic acid-binding protein
MDQARQAELIEQLLVEVTTQRLVTRAIVGQLLANSRKPVAQVVADLQEAVDKIAMIPLEDVEPELQERASELARRRAAALLDNLGAFVAPPRSVRARKSA